MSTITNQFRDLSCFFEGHDKAQAGDRLADSVKSYAVVVEVALETITRLQAGKIPDPTVGENACQLRAAFYTEILNADHFDQTLKTAKTALETAREKLKEAKPTGKREQCSLDTFLQKNNAHASLDERVHLLVLGRILEKTRAAQRSFAKDSVLGGVQPLEKVVEKDELKQAGLSKTAIQAIEKYAKKTLSQYSVSVVQAWAKELPDAIKSIRVSPLVSGANVKTTKLGLETSPCFSSAEVWLDTICRQKTPLILRISQVNAETGDVAGREVFFFKSDGNCYEPATEDDVKDKPAAFFIDAASIANPVLSRDELELELKKREIRATLLAFLATHPVYGGDCKNEPGPPEEDVYRATYVEHAREWECSPQKPRVCRPFHVYAVSTKYWKEVV